MKTLQLATFLSVATLGYASVSWADDGHNHRVRQAPPSRFTPRSFDDREDRLTYPSEHSDQERFSQERFAPSSAACRHGGNCCESGQGRTIENSTPPTAARPPAFGVSSRPNKSTTSQLDALLTRLQDDLRYETRGQRGQKILLEDNATLMRETRHFGQSVAESADAMHLRDDASRVKKSLIQLDEEMERQGRFPESERTLRDFAKLFVALENDLGLRNRVPVRNNMPPRPPIDAPFNNSYAAPQDSQFSAPARRYEPARPSTQRLPEDMKGIASLSSSDQTAALAQGTCPVTKQKLGSMGKPIRVTLSTGRSVWVCCEGCVNAVKANPQQYLTRGF